MSQLHTNLTALIRPRLPGFLARRQDADNVQPFQKYQVRNKLFGKFETLIEELIETRPLVKHQLCSVCDKFEWIIPTGADDLRLNARRDGYTGWKGPEGSGTIVDDDGQEKWTLKSVWLAEVLPAGSLFQLLTRPECRICMLVLHLLTPLPIKALLSWAVDQPLSTLHGFQYMMQYDQHEQILIRTRLPLSDIWQEAGTIGMKKELRVWAGLRDRTGAEEALNKSLIMKTWAEDDDDYEPKRDARLHPTTKEAEEVLEQSLVWESTNLSKKKLMNSSWVRTTDIDCALVNYWLRRCNEYHQHCHITRSQGRKDIAIRLIDVVDQCIVHGTLANRYFALSYVWGGIERLKATRENIATLEQKGALFARSSSLPRSILDAMAFVARLNQRYLWVDSLCIVQDDQAEKHDQIGFMHEIYTAAYATIVQHSGCDADAGLPGVREGSRSLIATKTHVGNHILMAKANYATPNVLRSSVHSTRGWTLQEVLLSTRCLHFFNKHLTFVCGEEWAQDWNMQYSNEDPSSSVATQELSRVSHRLWQMNPFSLIRAEDGRERDPNATKWLRYFEIYGRVLTDYTVRSLSFETDTLAAFQGLGGAIARLNGARFHFGLPSNCFDLALLWINLGSGERRATDPLFPTPSWTWAAWKGQSTYNLCNLSGDPSRPYIINSYVQWFFVVEDDGNSSEISKQPFINGTSDATTRSTPYYAARQAAREPGPIPDALSVQVLPRGCLHFWAEECTMDQLSVITDYNFHFIETTASKKRCGVLALSAKFHKWLWGSEHSLILMSESPEGLPLRTFEPGGGLNKTRLATTVMREVDFDYPAWYFDGTRTQFAWMFNVLLVKRDGPFVERVAFGQIHMLAWLELKRQRRYIRML